MRSNRKTRPLPEAIRNFRMDLPPAFDPNGRWLSQEAHDLSTSRRIFISGKQVPSCTLIAGFGSRSVYRNRNHLLAAGFPLEKEVLPGVYEDVGVQLVGALSGVSAGQVSYLSSLIEGHVDEAARAADLFRRPGEVDPFPEGEESDFEEDMPEGAYPTSDTDDSEEEDAGVTLPGGRKGQWRVKYVDIFSVINVLAYSEERNIPPPRVFTWNGDVLRLQDKLPSKLFGKQWPEGKRADVPFHRVKEWAAQKQLLLNHTFWGRLLKAWITDRKCEQHSWARSLYNLIKRMLQGWTKNPGKGWTSPDPETAKSTRKSRSSRFLQALVTIDGIMIQRIMSCPFLKMSWSWYDHNVLMLLDDILRDEVVDPASMTLEEVYATETYYSAIKRGRKAFKRAFMREDYAWTESEDFLQVPRPLRQMFRLCMETERGSTSTRFLRAGVAMQTRGAGTPPRVDVVRTEAEFLELASVAPPPLDPWVIPEISRAFEELLSEAPDEAFTGLLTKAGVRVTTAACYEATRAEGGTADAINHMIADAHAGRRCIIFDLHNGKAVEEKSLEELTPGEYIFWRSLEHVLSTPIDVLRTCMVLVVREPGKARTVTKAVAALKVVLDVVNGISSWALGKAFPSSASGMGMDSHGWNFFKMFFTDNEKYFPVREVTHAPGSAPGNVEETVHYGDVFVCSTDYSRATDFYHHDIASRLGEGWMRKVGIPPLLRGVVHATCYKPRTLQFRAKGPLSEIGDAVDGEVRCVTLRRGVLMGDPLTKVILHLLNMLVRRTSLRLSEYNSDTRAGSAGS